MMRWGRILVLAWAACLSGERADAELVVTEWLLATRTYNPAQSQFQSSLISTVQNPLLTTHSASIGNSSSTATYDFSWTGDDAHFGLTTQHHLEQLRGETISSGRIYLRPAVDSIVTFAGTWQYNWPGSTIGSTDFFMGVGDIDAQISIDSGSAHGGNVGVGPPFGVFNFTGGGLMQAGNLHILYYTFRINLDPTPPGTFGTGAGTFNFTIAPIPEPATLALLVVPMLILRHKRGMTGETSALPCT